MFGVLVKARVKQDHGPLSYSKTTALCPTARPPPSVLQQDPMPSVLQQDHGPLSYSKTPSPLSYSKTTPSFLPDQALCSTEPRPLSYRTTALCPTGPRPSVLQDHALCPTARPQPSVLLNHALCPTGPRPLSYRTTALCPTGPRPLSYRTLGGSGSPAVGSRSRWIVGSGSLSARWRKMTISCLQDIVLLFFGDVPDPHWH
ncbi:unnamed protein product [Gadus morhua 'NCC']